MTDDGEIVNHILRERHGHEKEYIVTVNRPYDDAFLRSMSRGVHILIHDPPLPSGAAFADGFQRLFWCRD